MISSSFTRIRFLIEMEYRFMKVCSLSYMDSIKVCPVMSDLFQCVYYYVESISIGISIRNHTY